MQKESDPALEGHMSSLQDSTIERQSADVHKLLLAESSRDTSKDQCRFGVSPVLRKLLTLILFQMMAICWGMIHVFVCCHMKQCFIGVFILQSNKCHFCNSN